MPFPSSVLFGVAPSDVDLGANVVAVCFAFSLAKNVSLDGVIPPPLAARWWECLKFAVGSAGRPFFARYPDLALAVGCCCFSLLGAWPLALGACDRIRTALEQKTYGLPSAPKVYPDYAFPAVVACAVCHSDDVVCMVGGFRRACMRCFQLHYACQFDNVRTTCA